MDATSGAGPVYRSGAPEITPGFTWGSCYSIFSFMSIFSRSLFVLLSLPFGHCVVYNSSIYGFWLSLCRGGSRGITRNTPTNFAPPSAIGKNM